MQAKKEVILSAGSVGTPQILQLSGIGAAEDLATLSSNDYIEALDTLREVDDVSLVAAPDGSVRERLSETQVRFKRLSADEIAAYLAGGEWHGKAGGYAIQGAAEGLIAWIAGSHSGVVGLPLFETRALLKAAGFEVA